ncbi:hypothetical protein V8F20_001205 [Naviculisporaceae sp. PSN 640]
MSSFFRLPAEIRLMIYRHLLVQDQGAIVPREDWGPLEWGVVLSNTNYSLHPYRTFTLCKRIYGEAAPVLYGENIFAFQDTASMEFFLENIGPHNSANIRNVLTPYLGFTGHFNSMYTYREQFECLARHCPDLRSVHTSLGWAAQVYYRAMMFEDFQATDFFADFMWEIMELFPKLNRFEARGLKRDMFWGWGARRGRLTDTQKRE